MSRTGDRVGTGAKSKMKRIAADRNKRKRAEKAARAAEKAANATAEATNA